jgi:hypothetical protein
MVLQLHLLKFVHWVLLSLYPRGSETIHCRHWAHLPPMPPLHLADPAGEDAIVP